LPLSCRGERRAHYVRPYAPPRHCPGPAVAVGRTSDRPPPGCDSTREESVFDQDRRMGRKAGIKSPLREVLRNSRFLSQFLGTFVWRQKYLARRRNTPLPDYHPTAGNFRRGKPPTAQKETSSRPQANSPLPRDLFTVCLFTFS